MRVVVFDTETTGTDPVNDRIVEITLAPEGAPVETFRVHPGIPIPAAASVIHGIFDDDVKDAPPFAEIAPKVQAIVEDALLLGYNSRSFDTPLLHAELRRAGERGIDLAKVEEIDIMRVWQAIEPRSLSGAVRRWLGEEHTGAHSSRADVEVTARVWERMKAAGVTLDAARAATRPESEIDREGKFAVRNDEVVYAFGKFNGHVVRQCDLGYLQWMMGKDFSSGTKALVSRLIENKGDLPELAARRAASAPAASVE